MRDGAGANRDLRLGPADVAVALGVGVVQVAGSVLMSHHQMARRALDPWGVSALGLFAWLLAMLSVAEAIRYRRERAAAAQRSRDEEAMRRTVWWRSACPWGRRSGPARPAARSGPGCVGHWESMTTGSSS
jgi:hypothetical protein